MSFILLILLYVPNAGRNFEPAPLAAGTYSSQAACDTAAANYIAAVRVQFPAATEHHTCAAS